MATGAGLVAPPSLLIVAVATGNLPREIRGRACKMTSLSYFLIIVR